MVNHTQILLSLSDMHEEQVHLLQANLGINHLYKEMC